MEELKKVIVELLLNWLGYDVQEREDQQAEEYRKLARRYALLERDNEKLRRTIKQLTREMQEIENFAAVFEKAHLKLRGEVRRSRRGFARRPAKIH